MKKTSILIMVCFLLSLSVLQTNAAAGETISWGEVKKATFEDLPIELVPDHNELKHGGFILETQKKTSDMSQADIIMDKYGNIGARAIVELGKEGLQEQTPLSKIAAPRTNATVRQGNSYYVVLHDGMQVKLYIEQLNYYKVVMSYVKAAKTAIPQPPDEQKPNPTPPVNPPQVDKEPLQITDLVEEGQVIILTWTADASIVRYDLYRSDNGTAFVKMNDFLLTQPYYEDRYTFEGHQYVYKWVAYGKDGKLIKQTVIKQVKIIKKVPIDEKIIKLTNIRLKINSYTAYINDKAYTLEAAPTLIDERTMVPLRFITEALGATLVWDGNERSISLALGSDSVVLWIDRSDAQVNGKIIFMDVPAQIVNGTTLVPIRFVAENLKQSITFNNETFEVTITGSKSVGLLNPVSEKPSVSEQKPVPAGQIDLNVFFKLYQMQIPFKSYTSDVLEISSAGTYNWVNDAYGKVSGVWERTNDPQFPLVLKKAKNGFDWRVGKTKAQSEGDIWVQHLTRGIIDETEYGYIID